jgi:DNA repair protein RecO
MSRETSYIAIILKKQQFGEGDEIITLYTQEIGKLRVLAKSSKLSKSKLQHALQTLFLTKITIVGNKNLAKVINAEVIETFSNIRESLEAAKMSFYAVELALKFTPDEQKNEDLFFLLRIFLNFLNSNKDNLQMLAWGMAKFKIDFLKAIGLAIHVPEQISQAEKIGFSNNRGSFVLLEQGIDSMPVNPQVLKQFLALRNLKFAELGTDFLTIGDNSELQHLLFGFISYQLEREIRSERLFGL